MNIATDKKLFLFDLDDTINTYKTVNVLPRRSEVLNDIHQDGGKIAFVSNQGGPAVRYDMYINRWGNPNAFPDYSQVVANVGQIIANLNLPSDCDPLVLLAFAFQKETGQWCPTPPEFDGNEEWVHYRRKPSPSMLQMAMNHFGISPEETLMVGDRDEDRDAAEAAEVDFCWAKLFFGDSQ